MNRPDLESGFNIRLFLVISAIVLLISYGLFNARDLLLGPSIEITQPTSQTETTENIFTIKGRAKNTAYISINQRPIFVDKEGFFEEKLILSPGFNIIEIKARDRFKKETQKTVSVYYKQDSTTLDPIYNASSTEEIIE